MIKLLNAGFARLRKSNLFWGLLLFSIGLALFMCYNQYQDMKTYGDIIETEQLMLNYSIMTGIVIAIFTSLFLGVEYSDGTIRNKIGVGHKRIDVYLSNLLITAFTSLVSYIVFIICIACIGIPLFGSIKMPITELAILLGCIFLAVIAYSGIFTFLAMTISNKAITAIVSIMLAFGLYMMALSCFNVISAQEYVTSVSMVDGQMVEEEIRNPKYPSEEKRMVSQVFLDMSPAGQTLQIAGRTEPNLKILSLYSLGIIIVSTTAGIVLFRKKDIN